MSLERAKSFAEEVAKQKESTLAPFQRLMVTVGLAIAYALFDIADQLRDSPKEFFGDALDMQGVIDAAVAESLVRSGDEGVPVDEFVQLGEDDDL
jgi:hypothetical protein